MSGRNAIAPHCRCLIGLAPVASIVLHLTLAAHPGSAYGQQPRENLKDNPRSNVEILGDLAIRCIGEVPDTLSSFLLESPATMPYLRPRLTGYWRSRGHRVFLADSLSPAARAAALFRLRYDPEEALVSYEPTDGARLRRTITLAIAHSLVAPSGLLADEGRCRDEYSDVISRAGISIVQRDPFPETRGEVPPEGSWRDWAEPVVLAGALGVVTYLFFSIRSS